MNTSKETLVSVIIPCYQAKTWLKRSIDSVLRQYEVNVEVIVVDDCSNDGSAEFVRSTYGKDTRVKVFDQPKNTGPSAARNRAIAMAKGDWIAVLDADDWMEQGRLSKLLQMSSENHCVVISDSFYLCSDASSNPHAIRFSDLTPICKTSMLDRSFLVRHGMGVLKPLFKRALLDESNTRYREEFRRGEDLIFLVELLGGNHKLGFYNHPMYYKQETPESLTKTSQTTLLTEMLKVFDFLAQKATAEKAGIFLSAVKSRKKIAHRALAWAKLKQLCKGKFKGITLKDFWNGLLHLLTYKKNFSREEL